MQSPAWRGSSATLTLSVVVPVYNEVEVLPAFYERLTRALERLGDSYEVVFVNDASNDGSLTLLTELRRRDSRVKVLGLSRNFGHQVAITAGVDYSAGQAVVIMDADLQDPPEIIPQLVAEWRTGYDVVFAVRESRRGESLFKRTTAALLSSPPAVDIHGHSVGRRRLPAAQPASSGSAEASSGEKSVRQRPRGVDRFFTHCCAVR
jgi:glycosyltransferase involved in cell wall biosynthesis